MIIKGKLYIPNGHACGGEWEDFAGTPEEIRVAVLDAMGDCGCCCPVFRTDGGLEFSPDPEGNLSWGLTASAGEILGLGYQAREIDIKFDQTDADAA